MEILGRILVELPRGQASIYGRIDRRRQRQNLPRHVIGDMTLMHTEFQKDLMKTVGSIPPDRWTETVINICPSILQWGLKKHWPYFYKCTLAQRWPNASTDKRWPNVGPTLLITNDGLTLAQRCIPKTLCQRWANVVGLTSPNKTRNTKQLKFSMITL